MKRLLFILFLVFGFSNSFAQTEMTKVQEDRFNNLAKEIRCIVCASEPVATSSAKIAIDMRQSIKEQILKGSSDKEIRSYFKNHYGEFVLLKPSFDGATIALWFAPIFLIIIGGVFMYFRFQNAPKNSEQEDIDALNALKELED